MRINAENAGDRYNMITVTYVRKIQKPLNHKIKHWRLCNLDSK